MGRRRKATRAPTGRPAKVAELVRQELGVMLTGGVIKDPRLDAAMATVTEVELSPDLKHARVYVSIFTDDPDRRQQVLDGLDSAAGQLQREIGARLGLRYTPMLRFEYDETIVRAARIESLLVDIAKDDPDSTDE